MKIKVCGMRDKNNIEQLIQLNPDYMGFIFYQESKRFVDTIEDDILAILPESIKKVGVFVDEPIDSLKEKYGRNKIDILQLHGNESPGYCRQLKNSQIQVIKAFKIDEDFDFRKTIDYDSCCDYFLFDTAGENAGGNGIKFNWEVLHQYKGSKPFFLSGGIGEEDLLSILHLSHSKFYGIDVNSRFETEPGKKDVGRLENFMMNLRVEAGDMNESRMQN